MKEKFFKIVWRKSERSKNWSEKIDGEKDKRKMNLKKRELKVKYIRKKSEIIKKRKRNN